MNRINQIFIVFLVIFTASCAQKKDRGLLFWQETAQEQLFASAQQQYQAGRYNDALMLYQQYLTQFPDTAQAPAVLLKIGQSHAHLDQYENAFSAFSRVEASYPRTQYAREAGVERLALFYRTGEYEKVTVYAGNVLGQALSAAQRIRVNVIAGDSYMVLKSPQDAYHSYLDAFRLVDGSEKQKVISRLKTAVAMMDPSDLAQALVVLEDRSPAGYLMYQLGLHHMAAGFAGDAVTTFSDFLEKFPGHEHAEAARQYIADLEASAIMDRHIVGCLLPMTGKYEQFGRQALRGIEFALSEFARTRGIGSVRILVRDTASDPQVARQGLDALADAGVSAIIGPIATAEDVSAHAQELRIPMVVLTQKPGVTDAGDYVFRNFLTPAMQLRTLANYAAAALFAKRFAILYPDENYGDVYMNLFWDEIMATGGKVVGVEAYDPAKTDFGDPIKKLVGLYYDIPEDLVEAPSTTPMVFNESACPEFPIAVPDVSDILSVEGSGNWHDKLMTAIMASRETAEAEKSEEAGPDPIVDFDALFIPDSPNKAGLIIPQLAYHDIDGVHLLGTNLWHSDKLIDMARKHVQGAVVAEGFFAESRAVHVHRFVSGFKYVYGGEVPGFIEAVSYDTAWILFDLITRPDIRFRAQIKQELYAMPPFTGVTGATTFDPTGEAVKDLYLLKVQGRRFLEIDQKGSSLQW